MQPQQFSNNYVTPRYVTQSRPGTRMNVPFVDIKKSRGTGIPFVDFDFNNPKPAPAPVGLTTNDFDWNALLGQPGQTNDTNTTNTGSYSGGYSAPTAPTSDPNAVAYWNQQAALLQGQLGQLDPTQQKGMENLQNSYNQSYNTLGDQFGRATRDYNTGREDTMQNYSQARNSVASNTRARLNSLQRLLGIAGAGNSSAALDAVPMAAAQEGTQQIAPVQQTYGRNRRNQDVALEDTTQDFGNQKTSLAQQLFQGQQGLRQSVETNRATLLDQIMNAGTQAGIAGGQNYQQAIDAQAPYKAQLDNLLGLITQLGNQYQSPVMQAGGVNFKAPTMGTYLPGKAGGILNDTPGADTIDPSFLSLLAGRREEDQLI